MFCQPYPEVSYLIYSPFAPHLLYYSHIPAAAVALLLSGFILLQNKKLLEAKILAVMSVMFAAWSVVDLFIWTQTNVAIVTYLWSFWYTFFCALFVLGAYFLYVFIKQKDASFPMKVGGMLSILPPVIMSAFGLDFQAFDVAGCNALATPLVLVYTYGISTLSFLGTAAFSLKEYLHAQREYRNKILFTSLGVLFFLVSFSVASYVSDISSLFKTSSDVFDIEQYGYFGMTVMIGFLTLTIVRYKAFNIKLIAAQALVTSLVILIGSQFLFIQNPINKVLNVITFVLCIGFGYLLVKSVKREVEIRELVQTQRDQLETANVRLRELDKQKTEFISFATHQLRSPLTAMKGNMSLVLEGDLGPVTEPIRNMAETVYTSIKTMINIVEDYLNVSRIELGTMQYNMMDMDFSALVKEVAAEQKPNIDAKGLAWSLQIDETQTYKIKADPDKFKQVLMNTIDNSIKYTPEGSIAISLAKRDGKVLFKVADTGVGIRADVMPKLFQKFSRAPKASEANIHGTGLGLFIAKEIMAAHGGRVWAESEGEGKGSQFYVELPEVK